MLMLLQFRAVLTIKFAKVVSAIAVWGCGVR
jgi:hypothetical protein